MKTLVLIRHSKAEDEYNNDFERTLTSSGIKLAQKIANSIPLPSSENIKFISSEAPRALQTAEIFSKYFNLLPENICTHTFLYNYYTFKQFVEFLETKYSNENNIWIFGHNPMLTEIVFNLSDGKIYSFPKCAVAYFEISSENWKFANKLNSELKLFINPSKLKD
ncbi:MAG: hypothetical protein A2X08_17670 [Bacteroidetes bacterium GWA2_32_17]|nr:MAG: hypothetical protein A2X08_17670 [Bacteroidetes bacterium GWA2_32_17]